MSAREDLLKVQKAKLKNFLNKYFYFTYNQKVMSYF